LKTAIITTLSYQNHDTGPGHPERIDRVTVVNEELKKFGKTIQWIEPREFDFSILEFAHTKNYLNEIKNAFPVSNHHLIDGDTVLSPGSQKAATDAVASILTAIDEVESKKCKNIFCSVRPPGHHAESDKAMGFCIYNNVAIGGMYLLKKYNYKKIAIIDFDVHHGNGTQEIFYNNPNVLYISSHQYPFYPGTGSEAEVVKFNNILNIPLDAGTNGNIFLNSYDEIFKKLKEFKPEFLFLSSGFDAHSADPLANINLNTLDFYELTKRIVEVSNEICNGKIVSILEGGYDLDALKYSAYNHVKALLEN